MLMETLFGDSSTSDLYHRFGGSFPPMIIDSFAGGGGASTGIEMALGRSPDIAVNHNADALALHAANHPQTLHLSENVYKVDPLDYMKGRHIGLAWFSPDCKHFSKAKGGKPVERNIRDLCWIIPGWIERIQKSGGRVDLVIMENVEEFKEYGPLIQTERGLMPDPEHKDKGFRKWCKKIRRLGGKLEFRELRACDFGAPTIRKRLFIIIRFDGLPIVWPEPTHGAPSDPDVIVGRKLPWRTAAEIIDWSLPCPSIFATVEEIKVSHGLKAVRPLADNTMARVARGMKRYVLDAEMPFLVSIAHGDSGGRREYPLDDPFGVVTAGGIGHPVVTPNLMSLKGKSRRDSGINAPHPTVLAGGGHSAVVAPHLMTMRNSGKPFNGANEPTHTITAGGAGLTLVAPVLTAAQQGGSVRSVEQPHHTITASRKDQNSVIMPTLIGCGGRAGQSRPRGGDEPMATITAKADVCVATAFVAQHNNDSRRKGGVNPGRSADEPLSTVTATGAQQGVVAAHITKMYGKSDAQSLAEPHHTIGARAKAGLVLPHLHAYYGADQDTPETEPLHTVTTKPRFGHVEAAISAPPFTEAQAARARQVADFLRAHGFWDEREFVTLDIGGETFVVVDIGMRMLTPRELYNAQGFPENYVIDGVWTVPETGGEPVWRPFAKSVQVSCVGNSVSPVMAQALVGANAEHCRVERMAA